MKTIRTILPFCLIMFATDHVFAQEACRVETPALKGKYTGDCKDGYASGKGEAMGMERYSGAFKKGKPNGKGTYYYSDSSVYTGNFQDGIKEGKGEMNYKTAVTGDSIVKGYWSGDVYRGNRYTTYSFTSNQVFQSSDISPMGENDNTVTFEIGTLTGSPNGTIKHSLTSPTGPGLSITDLISLEGEFIRKKTSNATGRVFSYTYEVLKFPAKLMGTFSNGRTFELELYKAARWTVALTSNE